jgi:SAM-dependent methyltransferase
MNTEMLRKNLQKPRSRRDIVQEICRGKNVLDIGCVHHQVENADSANWLHGDIIEVAASALGVDYLEDEVKNLTLRGYKVIAGDVNYPLPINQRFDVIVIGNLIEHLSSFAGLMENINRLLAEDGVALISTANPFFREQYFYSALKNDIIVNPEHTCWIDPVTLNVLSRRFELDTVEVLWVREKWKLSDAYFNGSDQMLNTFNGRWVFLSPQSRLERMVAPFLKIAFQRAVRSEKKLSFESRYRGDVNRMLYLKLKGLVLEAWWRLRRLSIPSSDINEHELYVSVLKRL